MPGPGDGVTERVHPGLGVGRERVECGEHDAGGPEHDRQRARAIDADAERAGRLITGPGGDGHAVGGLTGHFGALQHGRQPGVVESQGLEHVVAPAPPGDIEQQRSGRVRDVDRVRAAQTQPHVILGQRDPGDTAVDIGFVFAQPQQLGRREPGERTVAGQRNQPLEPDRPLDLLALLRGPLVVPQDRRAEHPVGRIEGDEPVHLAGEPDPGRRAGARAELIEYALTRRPPVLRVLLRPSRVGRREWVGDLGKGEHGPLGIDRDSLDGRSADVETDEALAPAHAPSAAPRVIIGGTLSRDRRRVSVNMPAAAQWQAAADPFRSNLR